MEPVACILLFISLVPGNKVKQLTLEETLSLQCVFCVVIIDISEACIEMLLIAKKIVPKNVLFTFAMLADFFEFLSKEIGHLSRQNVLKTL